MAVSKPLNPLNLNPNYLVVAAIDFGTTFSGYAFSFKANKDNISMNKRWGSSTGRESDKCPTSVLLNPDGEFYSFGYEAEEDYLQLDSDAGYQLYRKFKMVLYDKDFHAGSTILSVDGHPEKAITVFAAAIKFLKDHMLGIINRAVNEKLGTSDIRWVLTVPAIWNDEAKHFMRLAAFKAGIIKDVESNCLTIALEPEAASFYCRLGTDEVYSAKRPEHIDTKFKAGEKMLVIDAGGGTVDITAHEQLIDGKVKEIVQPSGGPWGGMAVDTKFMKLLCGVLGPDFINHLKSKLPQQWLEFFMRFEKSKKVFKADGKYQIKLAVPIGFSTEYRNLRGKNIESLFEEAEDERITLKNGFFIIKHDAVMNLYKDSCSKIVSHVKQLLESPSLKDLHNIILVGGYGESVALQNALENAFADKCKLIVPLSPQLSIVKGAVFFGHMPTGILSRLANATYGCAADHLFDKDIHDSSRKYRSKRDGQYRCRGTFHEFVKLGEEMKNPEVKTHIFHPLSKNENMVKIPFLMSHKAHVMYCGEPEVEQIGEVIMESPEGSLGDDIELRVTFGHTEILVEARDTQKGEDFSVKTSLSFAVNH